MHLLLRILPLSSLHATPAPGRPAPAGARTAKKPAVCHLSILINWPWSLHARGCGREWATLVNQGILQAKAHHVRFCCRVSARDMPNAHANGATSHSTPTCVFWPDLGSEVVFTAERGELNGKVVQWLPRACRVGAVEAVEWVRGRCVGGAASFLVLLNKKNKDFISKCTLFIGSVAS